ncbi:hypothetical protein EU537_02515 [Candidatus Thorarchaeota archaeon]|nr:MAG: hypothetical protein EU537_02515 [Candidatus Thorarchaeota archaeon]
MSPKTNNESDGKKRRAKYLFKVTVVGPDDSLLDEVLRVLNENVVSIDGIRIGSTEIEAEGTDVRAVTMSPKHTALDVLLTVTFTGAKGVLIIMKEPDPEIESIYRNEVREKLGAGIPTRIVFVGDQIEDYQKNQLIYNLGELVEEILEKRKK